MTIWGVDLGIRSAYAAGWDGDVLALSSLVLKPKQHSRSQELRLLHEWASVTLGLSDVVYIEEPPVAGSRNLRTFLGLSQASGVIASACQAEFVPVSSWKKGTVGHGGASKDDVADWLCRVHPDAYRESGGDQNLVDAICISLYGLICARVDQRRRDSRG